jgi:hypothetical protein
MGVAENYQLILRAIFFSPCVIWVREFSNFSFRHLMGLPGALFFSPLALAQRVFSFRRKAGLPPPEGGLA